ncbi:hypothetical protein BJ875DRAFT_442318 [Amylocarpus encephaloides]|uniref:Uncharacterized protein n=1 Tax=Amylocarpus encephaloides TaxID=45428 RepID=A0A9P7YGB5_9HELO|nr:hypothetical protein BJ875DRAFT_442318 [Amylocarpus encephaloides]
MPAYGGENCRQGQETGRPSRQQSGLTGRLEAKTTTKRRTAVDEDPGQSHTAGRTEYSRIGSLDGSPCHHNHPLFARCQQPSGAKKFYVDRAASCSLLALPIVLSHGANGPALRLAAAAGGVEGQAQRHRGVDDWNCDWDRNDFDQRSKRRRVTFLRFPGHGAVRSGDLRRKMSRRRLVTLSLVISSPVFESFDVAAGVLVAWHREIGALNPDPDMNASDLDSANVNPWDHAMPCLHAMPKPYRDRLVEALPPYETILRTSYSAKPICRYQPRDTTSPTSSPRRQRPREGWVRVRPHDGEDGEDGEDALLRCSVAALCSLVRLHMSNRPTGRIGIAQSSGIRDSTRRRRCRRDADSRCHMRDAR